MTTSLTTNFSRARLAAVILAAAAALAFSASLAGAAHASATGGTGLGTTSPSSTTTTAPTTTAPSSSSTATAPTGTTATAAAAGSTTAALATEAGERRVLAIGADSTLTAFSWQLGGPLAQSALGTLGTQVGAATSLTTDDDYAYVATAAPSGAITLIGWEPGIAGSTTSQILATIPGTLAMAALEGPGGSRHVFVLARGGVIRELSWNVGTPITSSTVTRATGGATGIAAFTGTDGTEHVVVLSRGGRLRILSIAAGDPTAPALSPLATLSGTTSIAGLTSTDGSEAVFALGASGALTQLTLPDGDGSRLTRTQLAPVTAGGGHAVTAFTTSDGGDHVVTLSRTGTIRTVYWTVGQTARPSTATLGTAGGASAVAAIG